MNKKILGLLAGYSLSCVMTCQVALAQSPGAADSNSAAPSKSASNQPESKQPDTQKTQVKASNSKNPDAKQSDAKNPDSNKPDSKKPEAKKPDSNRIEAKKADAKKAEAKKAEIKKAEIKKAEAGKPADRIAAESTRADAKKPLALTSPRSKVAIKQAELDPLKSKDNPATAAPPRSPKPAAPVTPAEHAKAAGKQAPQDKSSSVATTAALTGSSLADQPEVLVILPQKGAFSVAANSVHDGLMVAYNKGNFKPALRFVDNSQRALTDILSREVRKNTQLIIGPLAREQVAELVKAKPKVKVLALNQVDENASNIWQVALSPHEDARAITRRMQADGVTELIVINQSERAGSTSRFRDAMLSLWGNRLKDYPQIPANLTAQQGVLLLGDYDWLIKQTGLPRQKIYSLPLAIKENAILPTGLQFCDIPALYQPHWPELVEAYQQKPVGIPYQRLMAFGADAWDIATHILTTGGKQRLEGRTGQITITPTGIERMPTCMAVESQGLQFYS